MAQLRMPSMIMHDSAIVTTSFAQKVLLALSALLLVAVFSYTWPQEPLLPHASATNKGETSMTKYDTSGEEDVQTVQEIVPQVRSRSGKGRKKRHKKADQESRSSPEDNQESGPEATQPPTHEVKPTWIFCAGQWQECLCGGRVKWGNDDKWKMIELPKDRCWATGKLWPRLISSCEIFEEGQGTLQDLMNVRIDARFLKTYERHMETRQHIETWSATAPGDELIRSVHLFSNELIVVFHLGSLTPDTWTPERYPRLLLMHLAPLGPKVQKSFNYNKLRAMLISRVRVGVQLDSDQFVAPGADYMFNMTEREITREYPIPILPVHYFSFTQRDAPSNIWWRRFCPDPPKCELHSMRWSHAHPTWTFWALPWIGKWLRRHFRDEELTMAGEKGALRIADIPEDEDMLNVAAWEDKVTKQWCKFDNDRTEFEELIKWDPSMGTKCPPGTGCSNIMADSRFYPKGAAKAHFTAHNAKDPKETARWIDRIHARYKKGLYPTKVIVYQARGDDGLRRHHALGYPIQSREEKRSTLFVYIVFVGPGSWRKMHDFESL
ncbi:unnamed protein product [Durusdinium trenchii]|uniref:Uncharacterized protein n=1 Tax=Durusdinium trenchii TaxID=1381693 RepID=A0ABP0JLP2_9DINO